PRQRRDAVAVAGEGTAELAGRQVPDTDLAVFGGTRQHRPVGVERQRRDRLLVMHQFDRLAAAQFPNADAAVVVARGDGAARRVGCVSLLMAGFGSETTRAVGGRPLPDKLTILPFRNRGAIPRLPPAGRPGEPA